MDKALHTRDEVDRLYVSRKGRERGRPAFKIASTQRYKDSKTT